MGWYWRVCWWPMLLLIRTCDNPSFTWPIGQQGPTPPPLVAGANDGGPPTWYQWLFSWCKVCGRTCLMTFTLSVNCLYSSNHLHWLTLSLPPPTVVCLQSSLPAAVCAGSTGMESTQLAEVDVGVSQAIPSPSLQECQGGHWKVCVGYFTSWPYCLCCQECSCHFRLTVACSKVHLANCVQWIPSSTDPLGTLEMSCQWHSVIMCDLSFLLKVIFTLYNS